MSTLSSPTTAELSRLAGQANASHQKAGESIVAAIIHALEAGRALVEAQGLVPYGQWSRWLTDNFKGADRSARRWMRLIHQASRMMVANFAISEGCRLTGPMRNQRLLPLTLIPTPGVTAMTRRTTETMPMKTASVRQW